MLGIEQMYDNLTHFALLLVLKLKGLTDNVFMEWKLPLALIVVKLGLEQMKTGASIC